MNGINFYILICFYILFLIVSLYFEYKELKERKKLKVIDFFRFYYLIIYGIVPICSIIMMRNGDAFNLKAFKYLETTNVMFQYIVALMSFSMYAGINFTYNFLRNKKIIKKCNLNIIDSAGKKFYVGTFLALLFGWIALLLYTHAYGSPFGIFKYASLIRDNIFIVDNKLSFFEPFTKVLIYTSFNYIILLKNIRNKHFSYKVMTILLALLSFVGTFIVLVATDSRMLILVVVLIIAYYLFGSKIKFSSTKSIIKISIVGFAFLIVMMNLNNITNLIKGKSVTFDNGISVTEFVVNEFGYTYVNNLNILERKINKQNVDIRIDDNLKAISVTFLPRRYKKVISMDMHRYNTSFSQGIIGQFPSDVVTSSIYSLGFIGVIFFMAWLGFLLSRFDIFFENKQRNNDFYKVLFAYFGFYLCLRFVAYYDLSTILFECFGMIILVSILMVTNCKKFDFIINKIYDFLVSFVSKIGLKILSLKIFNKVSDYWFLKIKYLLRIGNNLNLISPKTFNEKINWLKLYDHNPLYSILVDKYAVRNYIKEQIGEEYLIPLINVYDRFEDINFIELPNQFVIKCNNDSGGLAICKDKSDFDIEKAKNKINHSFNNNYYYSCREWPYKNVKPQIIIEKYMEDNSSSELIDYKFMCFNGNPEIIFTCTERFDKTGLKVTFFDKNWQRLPFKRHYEVSTKKIDKPKNYDKMIEFSKILAKNFPFVRVDWYEINGKLYFGELTFYPGSGFEEFEPMEWDKKLGDMINLNIKGCNNEK